MHIHTQPNLSVHAFKYKYMGRDSGATIRGIGRDMSPHTKKKIRAYGPNGI